MRVRESNDMGYWLRFFLVAVIETAKASTETFRSIFALREETSRTLASLGRAAPNANRIVDYLYQKPFVTSQELTARLDMSKATADRLIAALSKCGILDEVTGQRRNRVFVFK